MPTESDLREAIIARAELAPRTRTHPVSGRAPTEARPTPRYRSRVALMSATAVAVLAVATAPTLLKHGTAPATDAGDGPGGSPTAPRPSTAVTTAFRIPDTPEQLTSLFRAVLGPTATFTVTDTGAPVRMLPSFTGPVASGTGPPAAPTPASSAPPTPSAPISSATATAPAAGPSATNPAGNGAAIVGTLTASGVTGGFDLQIFATDPGASAACDDPDRSTCAVHDLADGSSLAVGSERLRDDPTGITYQVSLVRSDGAEFVMHVSNEDDPKGESPVLAARPPLTTDQMTALLTSDGWGQ